MSQLITGGNVNVRKSYQESFGNLADGTVYADRMGVTGAPVDHSGSIAKSWEQEYRAVEEIMADGGSFREAIGQVAVAKGLTTADISLPVYPRQDLVDLTVRRTPFASMLPRITAETDTVSQDSVEALADPAIGGETDVPADGNDTITPQQLAMTYYRIRGSTSGPVQLAASNIRNSAAGEQSRKEMSMQQWEENLVLNGNPTSGTTDGSIQDERGYKGVLTLAEDNARTIEPAGGAGSTITVGDVRENMRLATDDGGDYASIVNVTDNKTLTDLKNALDDKGDSVEVTGPDGEISLGARAVLIDGVPTVVSDFMPSTAYDGTTNPDGRYFATVDLRYHRVHNLADLVMEPLAKTQDADEFFFKRYQVMEQAAGADKYTNVLKALA